MIRHPSNSNLTLHFEDTYRNLPVQFDKGPFIREYLNRLHETIARAIDQYRSVFAFRFDLRLPPDFNPHGLAYENQLIDRFIESFKAKIKHNRRVASLKKEYVHDSIVRYVWTREFGQEGRPHYHLAILLNRDAFCSLGKFSQERDNIFNRLQDAWSSALGMSTNDILGLVQIPKNPYYFLNRNDHESIANFFKRASYLCKSVTKSFGDGSHGFGASRT